MGASARKERFPLFDSLRALAALSVVVYHTGPAAGVGASSSLTPYLQRLDIGVSVFFLISGFLLYRPFVRAHLRGEHGPATGPYAWRRFLRIVPGYWVALTVVVIWLGLNGVFTAGGVVTYYGFGQVYSGETFGGGILQAWTLGVEITFYALLPVYALVLGRLLRSRPGLRVRGEMAGLVLLAGAGLAWTWGTVHFLDDFSRATLPWLFSLPAFLHQFAAGMALALASVLLSERTRQPAVVRLVERAPALSWLAAAGCFVLLAVGIGLDDGPMTDGKWVLRSVLSTAFAVCLLLPAVFGDSRRGAVRKLLASRVMVSLGVVSYGIYLYHLAVIRQLQDWGLGSIGGAPASLVTWTLLVTVGTTLIAFASWRLVERPALRFKGRVSDRRRDQPEPPAAAAAEPALAQAGGGA